MPEVQKMNLTERIEAVKHDGNTLEFPKFPVRFAGLDHV